MNRLCDNSVNLYKLMLQSYMKNDRGEILC